MILAEAIPLAKERLENIYGKEEANAITLMLCEHYFGIAKTDYYTSRQTTLAKPSVAFFMQALEKLQQHCPIQYILGEAYFYGLLFKLNESVLIPRPETEELVDWICKDYKTSHRQISILDIGTGSGAIAISLAKHLLSAGITAIDLSPSALKVAQANANFHNASVRFYEEDIFSPSSKLTGQMFDLIVSNPPYVRESEKVFMNLNVLSYEPAAALFVPDDDPLKYYRAIAEFASGCLTSSGSIYLEVNEGLVDETSALFQKEIYSATSRKDINGKDRMLKIKRL